MKVLFVGESWNGSSARSLCDALAEIRGVDVHHIAEDLWVPKHRSLAMRLSNRLLRPFQVSELNNEIQAYISARKPDVLLVYKGTYVNQSTISVARLHDVLTCNVFPDYSPHAYGNDLKIRMGLYDSVVTTKPFHSARWHSTYGYTNECVFVPHGFDPRIHLWNCAPTDARFDVVLAANCRPEYFRLMKQFAQATCSTGITVGIAGVGWEANIHDLPKAWVVHGPVLGRDYGEWLRKGRIALAPVNREVMVNGVRQPGDEDTTRTYELAAAHCFFVHQRTDYIESVYDEFTEVPMWNTPAELANLVKQFLPLEQKRKEMAAAAHRRAVPAYSIPRRAEAVVAHIRGALKARCQ
jgi:hypothetical protein